MRARRVVLAAIGLIASAALSDGQAVSPSASESSMSPAIHPVSPLHPARTRLLSALEAEGRRYLADATSIGKAPLRWNAERWSRFAGAAALLGALASQHEAISKEFQNRRSAKTDGFSRAVTPFGEYAAVGISAAALGGGLLFHDDRPRDVGRDAIEAEIFAAGIVTPLVKSVVGRARPRQGLDADEFRPFSGNQSFPSGHTTEAFAAASAIAARSQGWVTPTIAYALASGVALARVNDQTPFSSDVVVGAVIGTAIGRAVAARHRDPRLRSTGWALLPTVSPRGVGVALCLSLDPR